MKNYLRRVYKLRSLIAILILGLFLPCLATSHKTALRDPTQPSSYPSDVLVDAQNRDIKITAIFVGDKHKAVMIGNHIFTVGDEISGLKIIDIYADGIALEDEDGNKSKVTMPYPAVKLPTTSDKKKKP